MNNIIVLFPGGFKPLTGAHMYLAEKYAQSLTVKEVKMLIGPKDRDSITREDSLEIFELLNNSPAIEMLPTDYNSPLMAAYEYLFALPEDYKGKFVLAASSKGSDYERVKGFVANVEKYKISGDKKGRKIPQGVDAEEISIDISPLMTNDGNPISASTVRANLDSYDEFKKAYPQYDDAIVKNVYQILVNPEKFDNDNLFKGDFTIDGIPFDNVIVAKQGLEYGVHLFFKVPDYRTVKTAAKELGKIEKKFFGSKANPTGGYDKSGEYIVSGTYSKDDAVKFAKYLLTLNEANIANESVNIEDDLNTEQYTQEQYDSPINDKDWWLNELKCDIDAIFEGSMGHESAKKHKSKIDKLRKFLDSNHGKEFVYDFDNFEKTVFGVNLTEDNNSFNDYPESASNNAKKALKWKEEHGDEVKGGTQVGWTRARQLANKETLSRDVVSRMSQFNRHRKNSKVDPKYKNEPWKDNGYVAWLLWGGDAGVNWAMRQMDSLNESFQKKTRINEGGLGGHMYHPFEKYDLTFDDMKEIISRALQGHLDIEEPVVEKTDGQNIFVTYQDNQVKFARNKTERVTPLTTRELAEKFKGRGELTKAFVFAARDLSAAFNKVNRSKIKNIFKNGSVFANMEIIYPETKNVIAYETAVLQFHNLIEYDDKGNAIMADVAGASLIQKLIQDANAHLQKTFKIIPPRQLKLGRIDDFDKHQSQLFGEVDQLQSKYNLNSNDEVIMYHFKWWEDVIQQKCKNINYNIPSNLLNAIVRRWALNDKSLNKRNLKKQIENDEFQRWFEEYDQPQKLKQLKYENIEPFETIFLKLGAIVLENVENVLAMNPKKTTMELQKDIAAAIKQIRNTDDIQKLELLRKQLTRLEKIGGIEKIVPIEGLVFVYGGNTFKLTGSFAPVNQLLGILKYTR